MIDILNLSGELRNIYKNMPEYLNLNQEDKRFFDNLFILLLFNEDKCYSNKYLSQRFNIPISTIEKRIKRIAFQKLIKRKVNKENINGKWITTSRTIELDPFTFSYLMNQLNYKSIEQQIEQVRNIACKNKSGQLLENESNEDYSIRTGAVEVSKSFKDLLEDL